MRLPLIKHIILFLLLSGITSSLKATHLVGGSMSYEYVGRLGNGNYQYRVNLRIYRDCRASQVQFDDLISIAAYNANNNRTLSRIFNFTKATEVQVDPPRGAACPDDPPVCIREATYTRLIDLPPSSLGYHLVWKRCCRNDQNNILNDMGQTYYAFIPPTNIRNSSPFFTGVPAPYICQNDTTVYFNGASDPDGDSLSYRLVHPWSGLSDMDPVFDPPPPTIDIPFDRVIYRNGFNTVSPFGSNGIATINPFNGLTTMLSPAQGRYALAIEVTEWRNGIALSTIRLDVQIIVIPCNPNNNPNIAPTTGSYNRTIEAGKTLCFDIQASDIDFNTINGNQVPQNVTISGKGDIFGATGWQGPIATFQTRTGATTVTSQFCWTPSCDQARSAPYNFVVDAIDDGCPPKSRNVTFTIQVNEFVGEQNITGPTNICEGSDNISYSIPFAQGHQYVWTVVGGDIVGANNQNSVTVNWTNSGTGRVRVIETSAGGCVGVPAELDINVVAKPPPKNITGQDTVCESVSGNIYQVPPTVGSSFQWLINGGTITSQPQPNQVVVTWGAVGNGDIAVIETNAAGCPGDTNKFPVVITKPLLDTLFGSPSVCPNIKGVEYYVIPAAGASYEWFVEGGTIASGAGTDKITVDWGEEGTGFVKVVETLKWGCVGDTIPYQVDKGYNLKGFVPIGDNSVCEFTQGERYEVINTNGSQYFWTLTGGTKTQDDSSYFVLVDWGAQGNGMVEVIERSYDSVNNRECISQPVQLPVIINPIPTADEIIGTFVLCQSSGTYTYTINGFAGSSYIWRVDGDSANINGQGSNTINLDWDIDGQFTLSVLEITQDSCTNLLVDSLVTVNKKPVTTPIVGDSIVCNPFFANRTYTTTGFATSTFNWFINSGTINSGNGTPSINVDWSGQQNNTLQVIEVSDAGCLGDTIALPVFADHPKLKMRFVSVGFPDDRMETRWELTDAPRFNSEFTLQRRITGTNAWVDAGTIDKTTLTYVDRNINTDAAALDYRVKAKDLCGRDIFSDVHTSINLSGDKFNDDIYSVFINWTRYKGWTNGVRTYEVHRSIDFEPAFNLTKDKGSDTTDFYTDGFQFFTQRYRIKAFENGGNGDTSWSNEIFFNFDPVIWVPNAFTPNGDGLNSKFKIVYGSIKTFKLNIYDRWGELMFSTDDIDNNWDGTFKGRPCPDGVYIYTLRYSGADNVIKNLAGNITLLR